MSYVFYVTVCFAFILYLWKRLPPNHRYGKTEESIPNFTLQIDDIADIDNLHHHKLVLSSSFLYWMAKFRC